MDKRFFLIVVICAFIITTKAFAATGKSPSSAPSPSGTQIKNQNEVQTQNMGEEEQIRTNTQEQEQEQEQERERPETGSKMNENTAPASSAASERAMQHLQTVDNTIEQLLTNDTEKKGPVSDQIRQIAQEQQVAQQVIQNELHTIDSRDYFIKTLIGPDYKAIRSMQQQIEQNQLRIQQLTMVQNQAMNQADASSLSKTIKVLTEQNTALSEKIAQEEQTRSMFGWLVRLFIR